MGDQLIIASSGAFETRRCDGAQPRRRRARRDGLACRAQRFGRRNTGGDVEEAQGLEGGGGRVQRGVDGSPNCVTRRPEGVMTLRSSISETSTETRQRRAFCGPRWVDGDRNSRSEAASAAKWLAASSPIPLEGALVNGARVFRGDEQVDIWRAR